MIDTVLVQQVDMIGSESLQGRLTILLDILRTTVGTGGLAVGAANFEAELLVAISDLITTALQGT